MKISFVVPVYNEEKRVTRSLEAFAHYLPTQNWEHEVIFVDDGSTDKTLGVIKAFPPSFSYKIITYSPNQGKGHAVKRGMLAANGDYILMLDADMSTPLEEFAKFKPVLDPGTILIGSRKGQGASVLTHQSFIREKMGELYTLLARVLLVPSITDFTCGFKCFPKEGAQKIFALSVINRWSYDAEVLFLASFLGYKVKEIPVVWSDEKGSRVKLGVDSLRSLGELITIKLNSLSNRYKR